MRIYVWSTWRRCSLRRSRGRRTNPPDPKSQAGFDPLPPIPEASLRTGSRGNRLVNYIDTGEANWRPIVFLGGLATSARAFELTEFARTTREHLGLRAISVERNGFGDTPFDPTLGIDDAVDDVLFILDLLEVDRAVLVAVSGGGPYAAALAVRAPDRVLSLHLAAAAAGHLIAGSPAAAALARDADRLAADPAALWRFPDSSPVHRIPGFDTAAAAEGLRALGAEGRGAAVIAHEWHLLCRARRPSPGEIRSPAYVYHGTHDEIVPPIHAEFWRQVLGGPVTLRLYEREGHDVQYRHWDQILVDASGLGERTMVTQDGQTALVDADAADRLLRAGATLGLGAWGPTPP